MPDSDDTALTPEQTASQAIYRRPSAPDLTRRGALMAILSGVITLSAGITVLESTPASANGSWGGYQNGRIPLSQLSMVGGYYFRNDAAAALIALRNEYRSVRGTTLIISDGYRDYAGQEQALRDYGRPRAAVPGNSNHGWALAVDFGGTIFSGPDNDDHRWLQANAGRFGWWWAGQYFDYFEPWHWEYTGGDQEPAPESTSSSGVSENIVYIRRQSTGEIAIFGGNFRQSNGGQTGRHVFANLDEYNSWRRVVTAYNSESKRIGLPSQNLIPEPPANATDVLGITEGDWGVVCAVYGV